MTEALAADLIDRNINPDIYQIPPEESIYRYIYRPDGSYEPLAQIRQLTASEIAENERADETTWQQVPDLDKVLARAKENVQNGNNSGTKVTVPTYEVRYYQNFINGAPEELVDNAGNI